MSLLGLLACLFTARSPWARGIKNQIGSASSQPVLPSLRRRPRSPVNQVSDFPLHSEAVEQILHSFVDQRVEVTFGDMS